MGRKDKHGTFTTPQSAVFCGRLKIDRAEVCMIGLKKTSRSEPVRLAAVFLAVKGSCPKRACPAANADLFCR